MLNSVSRFYPTLFGYVRALQQLKLNVEFKEAFKAVNIA